MYGHDNYIYCGNHFAVYINIKLLYYIPEISVSIISQFKKNM